jgi:hypothetical protein
VSGDAPIRREAHVGELGLHLCGDLGDVGEVELVLGLIEQQDGRAFGVEHLAALALINGSNSSARCAPRRSQDS